MEPIVDVNGQMFYRCPYSHGLLNGNPIDALFPSEADREAHVDAFHGYPEVQ